MYGAETKFHLAPMNEAHWHHVRRIYEDGISTGQATFETASPCWDVWDSNHLRLGRIVAISEQEQIIGWAALSPVSKRPVYAGVAEVSVYVASASRGRGVGRALLEQLIRQSEENGVWTLQASIFPENVSSVALHEKCGFRRVGTRERIAQLDGVWRNTILMERRSELF